MSSIVSGLIGALIGALIGFLLFQRLAGWLADHWTAVVATCSMFVAVAALVLSISEWRAAQLHESLSVRPRFGYTYFYDNSGAGWRLMDSGLGPARLRAFRMLVDKKQQSGFDDLIKALGLPLPVPYEFTNPRVGDWYKADHENKLFWVKPSAAAAKLLTEWPRVTLEACYCSVYNECWLFSSDYLPSGPTGDDQRDDNCSTFVGQEHNRWWMG